MSAVDTARWVQITRYNFPELFVPSKAARRAGDIFIDAGVSSVLDVGCGVGRDAAYFNRRGMCSYAIDRCPEMIGRAEALWNERRQSVPFMRADMLQLPFKDRQFDAVFANRSLHFLPEEEKQREAVDEMKRVTSDEGIIFATMFSTNDLRYDHGLRVGERTYQNLRGTKMHYFLKDEATALFSGLSIDYIVECMEQIGAWNDRKRVYWEIMAHK